VILDGLTVEDGKESNGMNASYSDKLRGRKKDVDVTLRHLEKERQAVKNNTEWIDSAVYENRVNLLDDLIRWYQEETAQIDKVLGHLQGIRYGLCLACHEPIEAERLEICAEAEFCFDCEGDQSFMTGWASS
jgi:RNA polymerase-binding transcription factor DksA